MDNDQQSAEQWLDREDQVDREGRLSRLRWLQASYPDIEYQSLPGGELVHYLFEEARYCFVYAQFVATVMLGMAFIERMIAAALYGAGRDDLERANLSELLAAFQSYGWLSDVEYAQLDRARENRNRIFHFRRPMYPDTLEMRVLEREELPYTILEEDARNVLLIIFRLIESGPFSV